MIRPRGGNFVYFLSKELDIMLELENCRDLGVDGLAVGALTPLTISWIKMALRFIPKPVRDLIDHAYDI